MIPLGIDEIIEVVSGRTGAALKPFGVARLSTDTRTLQRGDLFIALAGDCFDGRAFVAEAFEKGACAVIVGQGIAAAEGRGGRPVIVVDDTRAALARLAANQRKHLAGTVIAVTGSNGKTTTKSMIDHVLKARFSGRASYKSFNNDVGVPLTLLSAESSDRYLVVEIGSNAPGEIAALATIAAPNIGVVTSIGHAHLAGFGGLAGVAKEKMSLFQHVASGGLGVLNLDDFDKVQAPPPPEGLNVVSFGMGEEADIRVVDVECELDAVRFRINGRYEVRLPVPGAHNARNAAAAFAVARRMQMEPEAIVEALADFRLPDMRLHVNRMERLTLVEDCYNANPTSMAAAIEVLTTARGGRRVLIAGEMMELGPEGPALHEEVGVLAARSGCDLLVAVGAGARAMVEAAERSALSFEATWCRTTDEACERVPGLLREGDTVLVKGSRAMAMEKVCGRIVERFSPNATHAASCG